MAEQAINTIYVLAEKPDIIAESIIKKMMKQVFHSGDRNHMSNSCENTTGNYALSQLIFLVGHIAIKQIVHMELIEAELRHRKSEAKSKNKEAEDDLDQAAGPIEDDVADTIGLVREKELLYDKSSLLAVFAPMVSKICASNKKYSVSFSYIITGFLVAKSGHYNAF